jgi:hypothetical protein
VSATAHDANVIAAQSGLRDWSESAAQLEGELERAIESFHA